MHNYDYYFSYKLKLINVLVDFSTTKIIRGKTAFKYFTPIFVVVGPFFLGFKDQALDLIF